MQNNNADVKLHKNTRKLVGISALRKIRIFVDLLNEQDRKNKKHLKLIIFIFTLIILLAAYYLFFSQRDYLHIQTGANNILFQQAEIKQEVS